jgi:hypothetical protein
VSSSKGTAVLNKFSTESSLLSIPKSYRTEEIETETLSQIINDHNLEVVDFLKVDIEGSEFAIFNDREWLKHVNRIAMELHPKFGKIGDIVNTLRYCGFEVFTSEGYNVESPYLYARRISSSSEGRRTG